MPTTRVMEAHVNDVSRDRTSFRTLPARRVLRILFAAAIVLLAHPVSAEVSVETLEAERDFDQTPVGAQCWILSGDAADGAPEGFSPGDSAANLFCPKCLKDTRCAADVPLRRIEQRLIPKLGEGGNYDCKDFCHRWLLRTGPEKDAALMLVRVGVPTVCGATGWCPGRIYERREGEWHLAGSYSSNEADELCVLENSGSCVRLWLTPLASPAQTVEIDWRN